VGPGWPFSLLFFIIILMFWILSLAGGCTGFFMLLATSLIAGSFMVNLARNFFSSAGATIGGAGLAARL
jgi:hypothetical protein